MQTIRVVHGVKTCSKCRQELPLSEFHKENRYASGFRSSCIVCNRKQQIAWEERNKKERWVYSRLRNATRSESGEAKTYNQFRKDAMRLWRIENRDRLKALAKVWRNNHPERNAMRVSLLPDYYVKDLLRKSTPSLRYVQEVPEELIRAKREHVKVRRLIKQRPDLIRE